MNAHTRKTFQSLTTGKAPRDLEWDAFISLWKDLADEVQNESGDRLSVTMNGHREVFRRPHDGRVSIEDVERARQLLRDHPQTEGGPTPGGSDSLVAVAIDERTARIYTFNLDAQNVQDSEKTVRNPEPDDRHLRKVERHTGNDEKHTLVTFYDDVARELVDVLNANGQNSFAILGHGTGTSNAGAGLAERITDKHPALRSRLAGVADVDLSAANDAELEQRARAVVSGS